MAERIVGVGVDVEPIARFAEADPRLFHATELAHCARQGDPARARAGTWCAKEAAVKALAGWRTVGLRQVVVSRDAAGAPQVAVLVADAPALQVSISYAAGLATAVAIAHR